MCEVLKTAVGAIARTNMTRKGNYYHFEHPHRGTHTHTLHTFAPADSQVAPTATPFARYTAYLTQQARRPGPDPRSLHVLHTLCLCPCLRPREGPDGLRARLLARSARARWTSPP